MPWVCAQCFMGNDDRDDFCSICGKVYTNGFIPEGNEPPKAFYEAIEKEDIVTLRELLGDKTDINMMDPGGSLPLHRAVIKKH